MARRLAVRSGRRAVSRLSLLLMAARFPRGSRIPYALFQRRPHATLDGRWLRLLRFMELRSSFPVLHQSTYVLRSAYSKINEYYLRQLYLWPPSCIISFNEVHMFYSPLKFPFSYRDLRRSVMLGETLISVIRLICSKVSWNSFMRVITNVSFFGYVASIINSYYYINRSN